MVTTKIREAVADPDQYADGEAPPSAQAIGAIVSLVEGAISPDDSSPSVSVYFGEIDVTWQVNGKLVRLSVGPDPIPGRIYFHRDSEAVMTRGHSRIANQESLNERLSWLANES